MRLVGEAYQCMSDYKCNQAIELFKKLPKKQLETGWVSGQIGRCYFEMVKYNESIKMYERMHKQDPCRLEGLEYYSTALWHLRK